jgi:DNA polymerase-3 subunit alpha
MTLNNNFIHLRVHSSYSLSEGAIKIQDLITACRKNHMPAVGLTDSGNLFAALEFSMEASKNGIQAIIGSILKLKITKSVNDANFYDQIVLIAMDDEGYKNLLWLVSSSFLNAKENQEHHITLEELEEHSEGVIALTGGVKGTVGRMILSNKLSDAEQFLLDLKRIFQDRLYVELMRHGSVDEIKTEKHFIDLAFRNNIPLVATNDVYFLKEDMHEAHEILLCIADGKYINDSTRRTSSKDHYFKSSKQMAVLFKDLPEAIENTVVIAKRCAVKAEESLPMFPKYEVTIGRDEEDEIRILAKRGLEQRLSSINDFDRNTKQSYYDRLEYELDVITRMQFSGYFLIVSDFIRWSKRNDIPVGPGRGSGAGSIVAWSLEITDLDPIRFGLLFERFLNPDRVSMPDFDIDFCQDRRDEVIEYVKQKYNVNRVAQIITFGKLQARAVIRDVGRVLQMPYTQVDRISKLVPFNPVSPVSLSQAIEMEPQLRQAKESDEEIGHLLDIALKLEGLNRHASIHAAGLVIANKDLIEFVPLYNDQKSNMLVTQYSMKYAEAAGLIKFDFLGLKTLTVLSNCIKLVKKRFPDFELGKISLEDQKTFAMLSKGESVGVFQFESAGMRDSLRKLKPDSFEDLIALGALYRPGPMDNIPTYIGCKHGLLKPNYLHPSLEPILNKTFGVIIYQEQVMEIARVLAGYTLGAADLLRRAMGKKIIEEMDAQRALFVNGAVARGVETNQATYIFDLVAKFAGYGFNKSHAVAYALISYQTAYLKANYPVEMLVALMNTEIDDSDKVSYFIQEAKNLCIKVIPVDINRSEPYFTIIYDENGNGMILYGLAALKNVGLGAMQLLCENRNSFGAFKDVSDFVSRCDQKVMNKRQLEHLIKAGAFDAMHLNRRQLFESIDILTKYNNAANQEKDTTQMDLFSGMDECNSVVLPSFKSVDNWNSSEVLEHECTALGFYLSAHPLDIYKQLFAKNNIVNIAQILNEFPDGLSKVKMAGVPISVRTKVSPRGRFVSVLMSDSTGAFELSIFDDELLEKNRDLLYTKTPLFITADVRKDSGGARLTASSISKLELYLAKQQISWLIEIDDPRSIDMVKQWLSSEDKGVGKVSITLRVHVEDNVIDMKLPETYYPNLNHFSSANLPEGIISVRQVD